MDIKKNLEICAIIVTLLGAGAGAVWALKSAEIQSLKCEVTSLEKLNKLNYPEFLEKISSASSSLKLHIDSLESIEVLKTQNKELATSNINLKKGNLELTKRLESEVQELTTEHKSEVVDLTKEHAITVENLTKRLRFQKLDYESKVKQLQSEIDEFNAESTLFILKRGEAEILKAGLVQVGFSNSNSDYECDVMINNNNLKLKAGGFVPLDIPNKSCKVVLKSCGYLSSEKTQFELICNEV